MRYSIILTALTAAVCSAAATPRLEKIIDRDWTFQYFPAQQPDLTPGSPHYHDSRWPAIAIPHTWSTYETTGDLHPFIKAATERDDSYWWYGWGRYRKHLIIGQEYSTRLLSLELDGVQKSPESSSTENRLPNTRGATTPSPSTSPRSSISARTT